MNTPTDDTQHGIPWYTLVEIARGYADDPPSAVTPDIVNLLRHLADRVEKLSNAAVIHRATRRDATALRSVAVHLDAGDLLDVAGRNWVDASGKILGKATSMERKVYREVHTV